MHKRKKDNEEIFDQLLRYAVARQLEKIADEAPPKDRAEKYTFSREFEEKMQRLFARKHL